MHVHEMSSRSVRDDSVRLTCEVYHYSVVVRVWSINESVIDNRIECVSHEQHDSRV